MWVGCPRMVRNFGFVALVSEGLACEIILIFHRPCEYTKPKFIIRGALFFGYFLLVEQKEVTGEWGQRPHDLFQS